MLLKGDWCYMHAKTRMVFFMTLRRVRVWTWIFITLYSATEDICRSYMCRLQNSHMPMSRLSSCCCHGPIISRCYLLCWFLHMTSVCNLALHNCLSVIKALSRPTDLIKLWHNHARSQASWNALQSNIALIFLLLWHNCSRWSSYTFPSGWQSCLSAWIQQSMLINLRWRLPILSQ